MTNAQTPDDDTVNATTSPYALLGGEATVSAMVERFYDLMELEPAYKALRDAHGPDLANARSRLFKFLTGWLGGPPLYEEEFGHPRLRARHMPFSIGILERDQWLACMNQSMVETGLEDAMRERLLGSFFQTADWMRNR
jgi:hemoglobin